MDLEAELLKTITKEELDKLTDEKIDSFHGFLTKEVALRLVAKERGLLKQDDKTYKLADIPKGEKRITFSAAVKKIWPVATYSSGKRSRVIEVQDDSSEKSLVLWNDDIELAKNLRSKDKVLISGAYEKSGELHLGYSGKLEITDKAGFSSLGELKDGERIHLRSFITKIEGFDKFILDGKARQGFSFIVSDGNQERRCIIIEGSDRSAKLKIGDEIILEGANVRNGNVEVDKETRLLSRRASNMLLGQVLKLESDEEEMTIDVEGNKMKFNRENALRLLGVAVSDDIKLSTVVGLKKDTLLNNRIAVKIENKDGQIVVRC